MDFASAGFVSAGFTADGCFAGLAAGEAVLAAGGLSLLTEGEGLRTGLGGAD
jgi:hypothetical protein